MIIILTGLSGSGKTTIAKRLSKQFRIPLITTCTTRPPRPGEIDAIDYHFMTKEEFENADIVAPEHFKVANGETWSYGVSETDLKGDCIIVMTPKGVTDLKAENKYDIVDIMINVKDEVRMKRILGRNDNQSSEEIERRDKADKKLFENYLPTFTVDNNYSLDYAVGAITILLAQ